MNHGPKKRALVLAGGGAKGAFQVGKIKQLVERGKRWDIISGVSVGALNALFLSQWHKADQDKAADRLVELWIDEVKSSKSIYKPWAPGILTYIPALWKGSLFSTAPLKNLIKTNVDLDLVRTSDVSISIGACSLTTGKYVQANKHNPDIFDYVLASASFPVAFPTVEVGNEILTDGGIRTCIPIREILHPSIGEIDVIMNNPMNEESFVEGDRLQRLLPKIFRIVDILSDEMFLMDLQELSIARGIKINVYSPNKQVDLHVLDFDNQKIRVLIDRGYEHKEQKITITANLTSLSLGPKVESVIPPEKSLPETIIESAKKANQIVPTDPEVLAPRQQQSE